MRSFLMLNLAVYAFTTVLEKVNGFVFSFLWDFRCILGGPFSRPFNELYRENFRTHFKKYIEGGTGLYYYYYYYYYYYSKKQYVDEISKYGVMYLRCLENMII